ncbi:hypothetical protein IW261DRAFT_1553893 [Armillaria novae-zelandiae]|uniref:Helitron helicase-like domain-containing protein n=1 Tax=Armillaria novae-zelandiae TaxID=153914 RepID=A0AA39T699_9AGAR|nr:hypothetical protein IW261DRAFT_1553893 [Armillaria novae-zelandiae]
MNLIHPPDEKPDLTIFRGSSAVGEYNNPDLIKGMFLTLFPFGRGGFEESHCPVSLSFEAQANYYLDLGDHSFRYHESFIFVVMNMVQRRQAHLHTHFTIRNSDFSKVAEDIKGHVARHLEEEGREKKVFALLSKVKTIASKVTGSEASKMLYRNEILAYCANPLMCGDVTVDLDDTLKWAMCLANDPTMIQYLFGWDFKKRCSTKEGGIIGHLKAFYDFLHSMKI